MQVQSKSPNYFNIFYYVEKGFTEDAAEKRYLRKRQLKPATEKFYHKITAPVMSF